MNYQNWLAKDEMTEQELDEVSGGLSSLQAQIQQQEMYAKMASNQAKMAQDRLNAAKSNLNKIIAIYSSSLNGYRI